MAESYLFGVTIGPVQDFIKAARRTRDLWFGSYVLSAMSRTAARFLEDAGMQLIYPVLDASDGPVPNKILGCFEDIDPERLPSIARDVKTRLASAWAESAEEVLEYVGARLGRASGPVIDERSFRQQISDVLETYTAWVPLDGRSYVEARQRLEALLAGRKMIRDFHPHHGNTRFKSALDGARESVLLREDPIPELGIRAREHLDAVGLMKRLGGGRRPYPSVVRVAVDTWIRQVISLENPGVERTLSELGQALDTLIRQGSDVVSRTDATSYPQYRAFPYDGKVLLEGFLHTQEFRSMPEHQRAVLAPALQAFRSAVEEAIQRGGGPPAGGETPRIGPYPKGYVALLMADGDRMGAALDQMTSMEAHKDFSRLLIRFASRAEKLVQSCHGVAVYAGGDDVFAFVPVDRALAAARMLRNAYEQEVAPFFPEGARPTLSVGIAIGYCREDLGDLRALAEVAESAAKEPDRNGLALYLSTRSGGQPLRYRAQWQNHPDEVLRRWVNWMREGAVPTTLGYEFYRLLRQYQSVDGLTPNWMAAEVRRVLLRKRAGESRDERLADEVIADVEALMNGDEPLQALGALADVLKIAKWLASIDAPLAGLPEEVL